MAKKERTVRQERVIREGEKQGKPVYRTFNALTDFTEQRRIGRMSTTQKMASERVLDGLETANPETDDQVQKNQKLRKAMAFQEKFANAMASDEAWRDFIWDAYGLYGKFFPPSRDEIIEALNSGKPFSECFSDPNVVRYLAGFEADCKMVKEVLTDVGVGTSQTKTSPADFTNYIAGVSTQGESLFAVTEDVKTAREHMESVYYKSAEYEGYIEDFRKEQGEILRQVRSDIKTKESEIKTIDSDLSSKRKERDSITASLNKIPEPNGQEYRDRQADRAAEIYVIERDIEDYEAQKNASKTSFDRERLEIMTSGKSGAELTEALADLDKRRRSFDSQFDGVIKARKNRISQLERDSENDKNKQIEIEETIAELESKRIAVDEEIRVLNATKVEKETERDALDEEATRLSQMVEGSDDVELKKLYNETHAEENDINITSMLEEAGLKNVADERIILEGEKIYVLPSSLKVGDRISPEFLYTSEEIDDPLLPILSTATGAEDVAKEKAIFTEFQHNLRATVEYDSRTRRQAARGQNFIYRNGKLRANYDNMSGIDAIVHSVYAITRVDNKIGDNKILQEIARLKATEFIMRGVDLGDPETTQRICKRLQTEAQKRIIYLKSTGMRESVYNDAVNIINERSAEIAHKTLIEMGYDPALVPATHAKNGFEYRPRTLTGEIRFSELVNTPVSTIAPHTLDEGTINGINKPKVSSLDAMNIAKVLFLSRMDGVPQSMSKWGNAITPEKLDEAFRRDGCEKLAGLVNKQLQQLQFYAHKGRKGKKFTEKEKAIVTDAVGQILAIIKNDPNQYIIKKLDPELLYNLVEVAPEQIQEVLVAIGDEAGVSGAEMINDTNPPTDTEGETEVGEPETEEDAEQSVVKPDVDAVLTRVKEIINTEPQSVKEARAQQKELSKLQGQYNDTMRDWKLNSEKIKRQNPDARIMEGSELNDEVYLPAQKLFADAKNIQKRRISTLASVNGGASV